MNQILLTEEPNNKKEKIKKVKGTTNNAIDIKKIIIFFSIVIIVFGISLVGFYGYRTYNNKTKGNSVISSSQEQITPLQLSLEKIDLTPEGDEEDKQVQKATIIVSSGVGIDKIIYSWNDEDEITKTYNGNTSVNEELDVPAGENSLYVKVVDLNGEEKETTTQFSIKNIELQPEIETSVINGQLKIVATSQIPLKNIKYSWENDDEIIVEPESDEEISIETTIDVKREKNKITITATDYNGNNKIISRTFIGKEKPEITVTKKKDKIHMVVTHYKGIKSIVFEINGKTYVYDENSSAYDESKTELEYYFNLQEGENKIYITATSLEDTVETIKKRCNYTPEE